MLQDLVFWMIVSQFKMAPKTHFLTMVLTLAYPDNCNNFFIIIASSLLRF